MRDLLGNPMTRKRGSGATGTEEALRHDGLNRL